MDGLTKLEQLFLGGNPLAVDVSVASAPDATATSVAGGVGVCEGPELHGVNLHASLCEWRRQRS
jgi:hypothetical protein